MRRIHRVCQGLIATNSSFWLLHTGLDVQICVCTSDIYDPRSSERVGRAADVSFPAIALTFAMEVATDHIAEANKHILVARCHCLHDLIFIF